MKAQSAVEYLTTYGWMLIAVSIVLGGAYSTIDRECNTRLSGFSNEALVATQATIGQNEFNMVVENSMFSSVGVQEIIIQDSSTDQQRTLISNKLVDPGQEKVLTFPRAPTGGCNNYDLRIRHNISSLDGRVIEGRLTVQGDLMVEPPELALFTVDY